ncbi:hypothetical protein GOC38_22455 [Sinorhizobium meliloti]|nr:hypothetical protein [Sinorhizobium meliloti]MDX0326886.1 hypothetical protein [Sinorhizobium meliloti]
MNQKSQKTFDLQGPSDLLEKLRYDIMRLKRARSSSELRYAAFDCAIGAWHMVDWLLAAISPSRQGYLTRTGTKIRSQGFITLNEDRLPGIRECQAVANSGKHRILTIMPDDPSLSARTTVRFDRPLDEGDVHTGQFPKPHPAAYISKGDQKIDAVVFFTTLERAWRKVLVEEGCLPPHVQSREIDHALWYSYSLNDYYWENE